MFVASNTVEVLMVSRETAPHEAWEKVGNSSMGRNNAKYFTP